ncbi:MAG: hypothetical protein CMB67_00275 [Euryarchaeota archaeon]|nr:hypothetical protein [Euryarchaeota archaeon]MBI87453.1 hypothetical protein [Euryarchaeota archaeon]OUW22140.1 MAG: hypothetical protein CBD33_03705 [Euryarchaeota archaeon TMED173]|tara:strand:+ start:1044 stop:1427 length:384 start_codon:yes stop_codon:yes gene_type:complete
MSDRLIDRLLDHRNVAMANIAWAVLHVWIAVEIEESMGFLAVVLVLGGVFAFAMVSEEVLARRVMILPSVLYLMVLPAVIGSLTGEMESSGYEWLDLIGPIIWFIIIPVTLLASTQEWTGIGARVEE